MMIDDSYDGGDDDDGMMVCVFMFGLLYVRLSQIRQSSPVLQLTLVSATSPDCIQRQACSAFPSVPKPYSMRYGPSEGPFDEFEAPPIRPLVQAWNDCTTTAAVTCELVFVLGVVRVAVAAVASAVVVVIE